MYMYTYKLYFILAFVFWYSSTCYSEIRPINEEDLAEISAQSGLSIKVSLGGDTDIGLEDASSGSVLAVNGLKLVERTDATGVITSIQSSFTVDIDVNGAKEVVVSTALAPNTALVVDSLKVASSIAGVAGAPSLGTVLLTDITGTTSITVRSH
jgi:hypothetical protein